MRLYNKCFLLVLICRSAEIEIFSFFIVKYSDSVDDDGDIKYDDDDKIAMMTSQTMINHGKLVVCGLRPSGALQTVVPLFMQMAMMMIMMMVMVMMRIMAMMMVMIMIMVIMMVMMMMMTR